MKLPSPSSFRYIADSPHRLRRRADDGLLQHHDFCSRVEGSHLSVWLHGLSRVLPTLRHPARPAAGADPQLRTTVEVRFAAEGMRGYPAVKAG